MSVKRDSFSIYSHKGRFNAGLDKAIEVIENYTSEEAEKDLLKQYADTEELKDLITQRELL